MTQIALLFQDGHEEFISCEVIESYYPTHVYVTRVSGEMKLCAKYLKGAHKFELIEPSRYLEHSVIGEYL